MEDREIVALYWQRDEGAVGRTAEKYGEYCRSIAENILRNQEDSQECVNDTWLRAWQGIPPQRPERLGPFLGKITRNLAFDRFKALRAEKRGGGETALVLEELGECLPSGENVEGQVLAKELETAMNRFVHTLPEQTCNVFLRRYFFGESAETIARRYGLTANHVAVLLSRARQKLRAYLKKEGYLE